MVSSVVVNPTYGFGRDGKHQPLLQSFRTWAIAMLQLQGGAQLCGQAVQHRKRGDHDGHRQQRGSRNRAEGSGGYAFEDLNDIERLLVGNIHRPCYGKG